MLQAFQISFLELRQLWRTNVVCRHCTIRLWSDLSQTLNLVCNKRVSWSPGLCIIKFEFRDRSFKIVRCCGGKNFLSAIDKAYRVCNGLLLIQNLSSKIFICWTEAYQPWSGAWTWRNMNVTITLGTTLFGSLLSEPPMASATYAVQLNCAKVSHRSHLFLSLAISTILCAFLKNNKICVQKNTQSVQCLSIKYHSNESFYLEIKTGLLSNCILKM